MTMADREASRCEQFGNLWAECVAPFGLFFAGVSLVFAIATCALAFLALRAPSNSDHR